MFAKHVLKVFERDIPVKYFIGESEIKDIDTVGKFLDNGLTNYTEVENDLKIEDNTIIIRVKGV